MSKTSIAPETLQVHHREYSLSLPFFQRRWLIHIADIAAINLALLIYVYLLPQYRLSWKLVQGHPTWFVTLTLLWVLMAHGFDAYDARALGQFRLSAFSILKASATAAVIYMFIPYLTPTLSPRRSIMFAFVPLMIALPMLERAAFTFLFSHTPFLQRTLIIGAGKAGRSVAEIVATQGRGLYQIVGFVDDDPAKQGMLVEVQNAKVPVVATRTTLRDVIRRYQVDTLVLAITHNIDANLLGILLDCLETGVEIVPMPVLYEQLTGRVPIQHVGDNWYVAMPIYHPLTQSLNRIIKRLSDIVLALMGLAILVPLFPLLALAIYIDSPGPIFYTQKRVGKGGRVFNMYKFRSMIPNAEAAGPVWADENDPRVTRVGRIMRKMHIDEFPQFFNILKGEMSAVGPRPERPEFVEELAREIPFYRVRHAVKPGMAGWALVKYGYVASKEDALKRLEYDLYYIKHWSPWFDLVILAKTVLDMITLRGRA